MSLRNRVLDEYKPLFDTGKTTGLYDKTERGIFVMLTSPLVFAESGHGGQRFATVDDALKAISKARLPHRVKK